MLCGIWFGVLLSLLALSSLHAEDDIGRGKKYWRKLRKPSRGQTSPPHVANKASQPSIIKEEENVDQIRQKDFPLFIVAGTQKSGTTALAAYLSLHPNITMSKKKELHFFDKNNNYQQGMVHYLEEFIHTENTMMYGEATPFYLASRQACARIAKHLPDAKLIILLREPVQRAYSEYQMKKRRVEEQEHFQRWMEYTALTTLQCLWQHPHNYQLILNCLPSSIRQHSRISKFTKALKKSMTKWSNWEDVVESCFPMDAVQAKQLAARHQQLNLHFAFNRSTYYYHQKVHHGQDIFDMQSCWQNYKEGYEAVSSLEKALQQEVQDFQRCSLPLQTTQILSLNKSTEMLSDEEQLELLDQQIEKCIKVKSGISSQYFYRSLYVAQLHHCFKSIPREQVLIVPSETLRKQPYETLASIADFLQLPSYTNWVPDQPEDLLVDIVHAKFTSFEKTTSWRLNSAYSPMPAHSRDFLQEFFAPYNELLFRYIKQNLTSSW